MSQLVRLEGKHTARTVQHIVHWWPDSWLWNLHSLVPLFIHFEIERLDHEVILKPSPKFQNQDLLAQFAWLQYVQDDETRSFGNCRTCLPVEDFLIENCVNADVKFLNKLLASICWSGLDHGNYNRIWQTGVAHTKRIDYQHCLTSIAYRKKLELSKNLRVDLFWKIMSGCEKCFLLKAF